jgi:hypothetical protein
MKRTAIDDRCARRAEMHPRSAFTLEAVANRKSVNKTIRGGICV